ncbi:MAG: pilin [Candidatus Paceibacterota bacterium]|jgi:hypothetical protein
MRRNFNKPILLFWLSIIVAVGLLSPITEINAQASRKAPCFIPNGDGTGGRVLTMNRQECESFFGTFDATSAPAREIRGENPSDIDCILYDADGVSNPRIVRMTRIVCESYHGTPSAANLGTGQPATSTNINSSPVVAPTQSVTYDSSPCIGKICNPLGTKGVASIPAFIQKLLEGVLQIGIPIVALAIIYCGFLFVAARGNSEKLGKAKDALLYTLIGAAILLGSWAIAQMISATVTGLGAGVV